MDIENVTLRMEGRKLIAEVDLAYEIGPSKSGKSTLVATTGGETVTLGALFNGGLSPADENIVVNVNVFRPTRSR